MSLQRTLKAGVILIALIAFAGAILILLAKSERGVQDVFNRTIGLRKIYSNVVKTAAPMDIRMCACQPDRVERGVFEPGFETTYSIYDHGGPGPRPGIVLIHGNVWMGQRLSTYRLAGYFLAKRGFIVLTYDKVGFGESDDPYGLGPEAVAAAYDRVSQVEQAVDYLIENTDVDRENITLLGHSGGVTEAMEYGRQSDRVANVVTWVAPFAPANEDEIKDNLEYLENKADATYEMIYGKSIPEWFVWEMTGIVDDEEYDAWEYFRQPDHKPLILVLGENDNPDAHESVYETFDSLTEPKEQVFVNRADHYLNSAQSLQWVFYDRKMVDQLIDGLVANLFPDKAKD